MRTESELYLSTYLKKQCVSIIYILIISKCGTHWCWKTWKTMNANMPVLMRSITRIGPRNHTNLLSFPENRQDL